MTPKAKPVHESEASPEVLPSPVEAPGHAAPRGAFGAAGNLSQAAYKTIRDMILTRQLAGGEIIVEGRLADLLRISRTPLREALVRLEGEGLLLKQALRSFTVREVTAAEFFQSMKVRELLEAEAVNLATGRVPDGELEKVRRAVERVPIARLHAREGWAVDDRLHNLLAHASGNTVLAQVICSLRITTQLFEVAHTLNRVPTTAQEHLAIIDAVAMGDARSARRAMLAHLKSVQKDVLDIVSGR